MADHRRMTIFRNLQSLRTLNRFKKLTERYFENVDYGSYGLTVVERPKARAIRSRLNLMLERAKRALSLAGLSPDLCDESRPEAAEHEEAVYLAENIFNLHQLKISPQALLDSVERAIGIYRDDKFRSLIRTLNPFFWLSVLLDCASSLPFAILGALGCNRSRIENSHFGKFLKGGFRVAVVVTVLAVILHRLGYLDPLGRNVLEFLSHLKLKGRELIAYLQDSSLRVRLKD